MNFHIIVTNGKLQNILYKKKFKKKKKKNFFYINVVAGRNFPTFIINNY